uniref:Uncharacterized protein n=1 Tax=Spironucleus salmonicida TaxID=348837 RepID=V6LWU2_9EUKA|eukprot:EST48698.1 Hypothetical protein SS50377_jh030 [Spironucleus salmonicida]
MQIIFQAGQGYIAISRRSTRLIRQVTNLQMSLIASIPYQLHPKSSPMRSIRSRRSSSSQAASRPVRHPPRSRQSSADRCAMQARRQSRKAARRSKDAQRGTISPHRATKKAAMSGAKASSSATCSTASQLAWDTGRQARSSGSREGSAPAAATRPSAAICWASGSCSKPASSRTPGALWWPRQRRPQARQDAGVRGPWPQKAQPQRWSSSCPAAPRRGAPGGSCCTARASWQPNWAAAAWCSIVRCRTAATRRTSRSRSTSGSLEKALVTTWSCSGAQGMPKSAARACTCGRYWAAKGEAEAKRSESRSRWFWSPAGVQGVRLPWSRGKRRRRYSCIRSGHSSLIPTRKSSRWIMRFTFRSIWWERSARSATRASSFLAAVFWQVILTRRLLVGSGRACWRRKLRCTTGSWAGEARRIWRSSWGTQRAPASFRPSISLPNEYYTCY